MESKVLMLLLSTFCIGMQSTDAISVVIKTPHKYITLNTTWNCIQNFSYANSDKTRLTAQEKQALLDMHNALRNKIAKGEEKNTMRGAAPKATNMMAMEWDDILADYAQNWANLHSGTHSKMNITHENYARAEFAENLGGGVTTIDDDMYGEVKDWDYFNQKCRPMHQCGHYFAVTAWSHFRMGCGYQMWKKGDIDKSWSVCIFAPYSTAGIVVGDKERQRHQYEYWSGTEACSECLQGWDYCMGGGLCATKKQCDASDDKCECTHSQTECESNNGKFSSENCKCKCPPGRYGKNCARQCKDTPNDLTCSGSEFCSSLMEAMIICPKSCGDCGTDTSAFYKYWMDKRPAQNRDNIKVRATPPLEKESSRLPKTISVTGAGCKNRENDYVCEQIRIRNYCNDVENGRLWRYFCSASCKTCGDNEYEAVLGGDPTKGGQSPYSCDEEDKGDANKDAGWESTGWKDSSGNSIDLDSSTGNDADWKDYSSDTGIWKSY